MPENVSFAEIPVDIRTPGQYIEIDNSKAVQGLPTQDRKILILGQRLAAGTVAQKVPMRVLNADQAAGYFGRGSLLHGMIAAAKAANPYTDMWAVALDDAGAGVAATGTITVTGTPTEAGTINLYIGGVRLQAGVAANDSVTVVAAAIAAAINAAADLPVTATSALGVATITARHKGETGNAIDVRFNYYMGEATPKGITLAIAAMSGGTGNPAMADALSAIGSDQYYTIATPWTDSANMVALESELGTRWGPMSQKTGHAFAGLSGTHGTLTTYGAARNSLHSTVVGSGKSPSAPWIWASILAAVCEFNGAIDPARPFQTLLLPGLLPPSEKERFTRDERNLLLKDGISTFLVDAGGRVLIERVITTYQTNSFGVEDISYLDLETKWTVDYIRYAVRARIALRFPRYKLANDGTNFAPGQAIVTPRVIRAELLGLFRELEQSGLVENFDQFKADLLVVRSNSDPNRINAVIPPDIVNQFRVFAAAVQFRL
ncbi:phage tail sheath subtilisin-like domain-containing protein [Nitrosovibrio sp. Nv4]|uniref:phage tail sheath subtilisin-like domain-containing protein n=1 Tax=Nitrosovibrio sp. Nv4 TaxID=1945880 RepID=UPI000BCEE60D|nr:phage tail sheath subtilisin-like domain-containing protein [Nitrosovibrio sp. Nv4]SOD42331.1 Mu-like prophage tail sheath protein gpL [Nitrosovibrio sp. Nv4]